MRRPSAVSTSIGLSSCAGGRAVTSLAPNACAAPSTTTSVGTARILLIANVIKRAGSVVE
jgi:hypothetical protein